MLDYGYHNQAHSHQYLPNGTYFRAAKFDIGYEKNMTFLGIQNLQKFEKKNRKNRMDSFKANNQG